jgi:hypothetical protein
MLKVLEEEQQAVNILNITKETLRDQRLSQCKTDDERQKLERQFGVERAKA